MISLVDLGVSNLASVVRAFQRIGAPPQVATRADDVVDAEVVVLPGVGAFGDGMRSLQEKGLVAPLRSHVEAGRPLIGICLGMQLLADASSEHGRHDGLGLVPGQVARLNPDDPDYRVPNIGWCDLALTGRGTSIPEDLDGRACYFVHSFYLDCDDEADVTATISFAGQQIVAAVERGSVFGVQFHPEKSQDAGLEVLDAVLRTAHSVAP